MSLSPLETIHPPTDLSPEALLAFVEEINQANTRVYEALQGLYGNGEDAATLTGDLDLDGYRLRGLGISDSDSSACPRGELIEHALYAQNGKHTAHAPIIATKGVFLDAARVREPDEAISKAEVDRLLNAVSGAAITDHGALSGLGDDDHPQYMLDADFTAANIRALGFFDITNDGTGSGLDADLLDGSHASAFALANHDHGTAHSGLTDDDHAQYALLAGRSGGQTLIGGTGTTDDLILRVTSGVGTTGADMIFQGGNNGATEFARFLNSGNFGVGTNNPVANLHVFGTGGATIQRDSASNPVVGVRFRNDNTTTPNGSAFDYQFADTGGTVRNVVGIIGRATARGAATVTTELAFGVANAATVYTEKLKLDSSALFPTAAKGLTLGTTTLGWGPAFFADNAAQPSPGTNQGAVYAYDSGGGTTEMWVADEAGNDTQISPHYDPDLATAAGVTLDADDPFPRIAYERNRFLGKEAFTYTSPTTGLTQRIVRDLPKELLLDWDKVQDERMAAQQAVVDEWQRAKVANEMALAKWEKDGGEKPQPFTEPQPAQPVRKQAPKWIADRIKQ